MALFQEKPSTTSRSVKFYLTGSRNRVFIAEYFSDRDMRNRMIFKVLDNLKLWYIFGFWIDVLWICNDNTLVQIVVVEWFCLKFQSFLPSENNIQTQDNDHPKDKSKCCTKNNWNHMTLVKVIQPIFSW